MVTIPQGLASRRIYNNHRKIVGYCVKRDREWIAIIFQEGPKRFRVDARSPIIQKDGDIIITDNKLKDLRLKIDDFLNQKGWN